MSPRAKKDDKKKAEEDVPDSALGTFTPQDLASLVQFDDSAFNYGETPIEDGDAANILRNRMSGYTNGPTDEHTRAIIELIVNAVPKDYRSKSVMENLDLRPYFAAISGQGKKKILVRHYEGMVAPDWSETYGVDIGAIGKTFLDNEQRTIRESAVKAQAGAQLNMTKAESDAALAGIERFNPGRAGASPLGDKAKQEAIVQGKSVDGFAPKTVAGQVAAFSPFDVEQLRKLTETDMLSLEQLSDQEAQLNAQNGGGYFPMEVEQGTQRPLEVRDGAPVAPTTPQPTMSVLDAMNYLATLTPDKVKDMQHKLATAGYFDRVAARGSTDGTPRATVPIEEGYAFDPATMAAWKELLTDSVKENKPVWQVVADKGRDYRDVRRKKMLSGLLDVDTEYANMAANDYAMSVLGHSLTRDELQKMNQHLISLRQERAGFVAGADDNTADMGLPNEQGFTQDDIQQYVEGATGDQQRANSFSSRMYSLNKLMKK